MKSRLSWFLLFVCCSCSPGKEALREKAVKLSSSGDHPVLCRLIEWAANSKPQDGAFQLAHGQCLEHRGNRAKAIEAAQRAIVHGEKAIRLEAYALLEREDTQLKVPSAGQCRTLASSCGKKMFLCSYDFERYGSGGGDKGLALRVARDEVAARAALTMKSADPVDRGNIGDRPTESPEGVLDVALASRWEEFCGCGDLPQEKQAACQRQCDKAAYSTECKVVHAEPCDGRVGLVCSGEMQPPRKHSAEFLLLEKAGSAPDARPRPSFNCDSASTHVEKTICASAPLAALDLQMSHAFAKALQVAVSPEARGYLKTAQRAWLKRRDNTLSQELNSEAQVGALSSIYRERIEELVNAAEVRRVGDFNGVKGAGPLQVKLPDGCFVYEHYVVHVRATDEGDDIRAEIRPDNSKVTAELCERSGLPLAYHVVPNDDNGSFAGIVNDVLLVDYGTAAVGRSLGLYGLKGDHLKSEVGYWANIEVKNGTIQGAEEIPEVRKCTSLDQASDRCGMASHKVIECVRSLVPRLANAKEPAESEIAAIVQGAKAWGCNFVVTEEFQVDLGTLKEGRKGIVHFELDEG